ncbi:MAG: FAD-dependent oxidoreductase [Parvibaculum sp.]|nr:FAD-dependent oxidoreductase [Parvibaculum sp.]
MDVAIIGAGLSGLTSARDLKRAGSNSFIVLEARDRVGGRTCNHDLGNGVVSEGGGQWIGPGQTAIANLARELGVETFDSFHIGRTVYLAGHDKFEQDEGDGSMIGGEAVGTLNALARFVPSAAPWTAANAAELDRQSLADWLAQQPLTEDEAISFELTATLTFGAPPAKLGLLHYLSVINSSGCDLGRLEAMKGGAQEKRFVGGSFILSAKMAEAVTGNIRLSSPVSRIAGWDGDIVELHTDREIIRARQVIVAMSPSLCDRIAFDPPLPAGRAEMQKLWPTNGRMRKTVHVYTRPFWRDAGLNGQVIQIGGPLLWSADNSPPDASLGVLTAFVKEAALPADSKKARDMLSAIYAEALGKQALHPVQYHEIDWSVHDNWSLSCTSPYPPGFLTKWGRHIHPPLGRLIWSGTDTAEIHASSMDGAVRAGHRAALQALRSLTEKKSTSCAGA